MGADYCAAVLSNRFDLLYLNGTLAKEQASITGLQTGVVDMTTQTTAFVEPLIPRVQALDLPFLFARRQNAERLLDGDVGRELFAELAQKGIVGLAWGTAGWREFEFRDTRVKEPADMRGLRMRIQNGPVYVSMMKALGAIPVVIDFSETYTALAQKTIDGLDIPLTTILAQKFNEVTRNIALSNHLYNPGPLLMSKQRYDSLTPEQQRVLVDASRDILPIWRNTFADAHTAAIEECKSKGVAVDAVDYPAFKRAMAPVYAEYRERLGRDVVDRIIKIAG